MCMTSRIDPGQLERARGLLIAKLCRNVSWQEFSEILGISNSTINNIRSGRTYGSVETWRKIVDALREYECDVTGLDLLTEAPQLVPA